MQSFIFNQRMIISVYKREDTQPKTYQYSNIKQKVIIGRNPNCEQTQTIIIDEPSASRTHLAVKLKQNQLKIMDLGSSKFASILGNGTKVNQTQIQPYEWVKINHGDNIILGQSQGKIKITLINNQTQSSSQSNSRSRQKKKKTKFQDLFKQLKISDSSLKMLKQMAIEKKSKDQKIKFLKLMGCKNVQKHWQQIEQFIKNQNKFSISSKKASQQLQKQFQSGRSTFQKKGLGRR